MKLCEYYAQSIFLKIFGGKKWALYDGVSKSFRTGRLANGTTICR